MYDVVTKTGISAGNSDSHDLAMNREESKLTQLKSLVFELREANISLNSRVREMKLFLCGDEPEKDKIGQEKVNANGELQVLINVTRDTLMEVNKTHNYMSDLEREIKP